MNPFTRLRSYAEAHGVAYTVRRGAQKAAETLLGTYDQKWRKQKAVPEELKQQRLRQPEAGLLSVLIPVWNTDPLMLEALLFSLVAQTYANWEAVLYDGCSTREKTKDVLTRYATKDARLRVISGDTNEGISGNTNRAAELAHGEYLVLCDHDDLLSPDALWRVAQAIEQEQPDMLYSDEDMITQDGLVHVSPHLKPDFCPENLNSSNYICHLLAMKKSLWQAVGGLRSGFDGSQDHDLALRLTEKTDRILHLPYTLYSWRRVRSSMSHQHLDTCVSAGCRAVREHMEKQGLHLRAEPVQGRIRLWYEVPGDPTVETIPMTSYADANRAAAASQADYLFFADPDLEILAPETFMLELLMYAQQDGVGAVTPVLTERHGHITHGGFTTAVVTGAACVHEGLYCGAGGWRQIMSMVHNVIAVSPCAMLIRRDRFLPFDEAYATGFGAVDLCLRLRKQGLRHVFVPHARANCGNRDMLLSGKKRNPADLTHFRASWGEQFPDPCYGSRFSDQKANFRLKKNEDIKKSF